jgi:acetyl/propionyl-CoA carboxylase alpha subunit
MEAVAVYSDADASAAHVRAADHAVRLGPAAPAESYLRIDASVAAALASGAEAVHPGYGFLAEREAFARAVQEAGLAWVGPPPAAIAALGDKLAARRAAREADVPHVPGTLEAAPVDRPEAVEAVLAEARRVGYPLLVKAAAGGGGRGMRRVVAEDELPAALLAGSREAASAFGDGSVYLEREIMPARHIEVQLLGDAEGTVVALGERDCSMQRRHQKLIEEAPAPGLTETERRRLHALAVRLGSAAGLRHAATCEFLYDRDGAFWFLEVNTRLQVEHPVTELVAGIDIVQEQFHLAAGRPLSDRVRAAADRAARLASHAMELRISAEYPARVFAPMPGRITRWRMPSGPGIRVDSAVEEGDRVPAEYDPLIAKLIVHAGIVRRSSPVSVALSTKSRWGASRPPSRSTGRCSPSQPSSRRAPCRRHGSTPTGMVSPPGRRPCGWRRWPRGSPPWTATGRPRTRSSRARKQRRRPAAGAAAPPGPGRPAGGPSPRTDGLDEHAACPAARHDRGTQRA